MVQSPKSLLISDNRVPLTPSKARNGLFPGESSSLPVPSAEQVASYFSQRMGTNVTPNEVDSMITNLQTTRKEPNYPRFTMLTLFRQLNTKDSSLLLRPQVANCHHRTRRRTLGPVPLLEPLLPKNSREIPMVFTAGKEQEVLGPLVGRTDMVPQQLVPLQQNQRHLLLQNRLIYLSKITNEGKLGMAFLLALNHLGHLIPLILQYPSQTLLLVLHGQMGS